jgi:ABC-type transport system involved in multi-copper enzyme maturation permease subunit
MTMALSNPVLTKEMRSRLRGGKGLWVQAAYLLILSIIVSFMYLTWALRHGGPVPSPTGYSYSGPKAWETGQLIFRVLSVAQAVLIALIAPALTCGTLSLERERQTLDFLLMTPLTAVSIVLGKLLSAFLFMGLLLTLSLPLASVSFLLGGVSPGELAGVYAALVVEAVLLCSLGLAWSATFPRTTISTPFAYGFTLAFMVGSAMLFAMDQGVRIGGRGGSSDSFALAGMNPICLPFISAQHTSLFGWKLPVAYPGTALNLLIAIAVLAAAAHRLASLRGRSHATAVRLLTCLTVVCAASAVAGDLSVRTAMGHSLPGWALWITAVAICSTIALGLLAPAFSTEEPHPEVPLTRRVSRALNPLRVFHGEAPTAALYLILTLLLTLPAVSVSIATMKGPFSPPSGMHTPAPPPPVSTSPGAPSPSSPTTPVSWSRAQAQGWCRGVVTDLYALMACTLLAYVALGWAVSAVTSNRWVALGIAMALVVALGLIPFTGVSDFDYGGGVPDVNAYGNILYASPYFAAMAAVQGKWLKDPFVSGFWFDGTVPFERVTMALHLALFVFFSGIAYLALAARQRKAAARDLERAPPPPAKPESEGAADPDSAAEG